MSRVDLRVANLDGTNLKKIYFNETIINEKQVDRICEKNDLSGSKVYLSETDEVISYEEYCIRRQKNGI